MPYHLDWLVKDDVLYAYVYGVYTIQDLEAMTHELNTVIEAGEPFIHTIIDVRPIIELNLNAIDVQRVMKLVITHPNRGWTITVTSNQLHTFLGNMATQFASVRGRHFTSMEDALTFIAEQEPAVERQQLKQALGKLRDKYETI